MGLWFTHYSCYCLACKSFSAGWDSGQGHVFNSRHSSPTGPDRIGPDWTRTDSAGPNWTRPVPTRPDPTISRASWRFSFIWGWGGGGGHVHLTWMHLYEEKKNTFLDFLLGWGVDFCPLPFQSGLQEALGSDLVDMFCTVTATTSMMHSLGIKNVCNK